MARSNAQTKAKQAAMQQVVDILRANYPKMTTSYWLENKLETSQRCIHRYIRDLRKQGLVIDAFPGRGGGFVLRTKSVAIERLIKEVAVDAPVGGYNRTYHRHNR